MNLCGRGLGTRLVDVPRGTHGCSCSLGQGRDAQALGNRLHLCHCLQELQLEVGLEREKGRNKLAAVQQKTKQLHFHITIQLLLFVGLGVGGGGGRTRLAADKNTCSKAIHSTHSPGS